MSAVRQWLDSIGLGRYADAFEENHVDHEVLRELDHELLVQLGVVSVGHRVKILRARDALSAQREEVVPGSSTREPRPQPLRSASDIQRRQLTVMFCDLVGSTALSQHLDPEELRKVIRSYQDLCRSTIERYDGFVARYMGDGVLAYFGYPRAHEDAAERAVRAGYKLTQEVQTLDVGVTSPASHHPSMRVGVATGLVVVGDLIGEEASVESPVVGETPNLAARLQALAEAGTVVVAPSTRRLVGGQFEFRDLGEREMKGIQAPVRLWQVMAEARAESRFAASHGEGTVLVGRDEELATLQTHWRRAQDGQGQAVLLSGEAGIGKSRLVRALELSVDQAAGLLRYQCSPHHDRSALYPVITQLTREAKLSDGPVDASRRVGALRTLLARYSEDPDGELPSFASLLSVPLGDDYPNPDPSPRRRREALLAALVRQLRGRCRDAPLLVVLEDAHWIDPSTEELLELLVRNVADLPVLVVVTARPEYHPRWLEQPRTAAMVLHRLGGASSVSLVQQVLGGGALSDSLVSQIAARSDGVPLYIEELTRSVLESMQSASNPRQPDRLFAASDPPIPESLQDLLLARLDRLEGARETAQLAAALGRTFSREQLASVSPLSERALDEAMDRLIAGDFVRRRATASGTAYEFRHALLRDAAYQSLLHSVRRTFHARIADALERGFGSLVWAEPETLAHHLEEAGDGHRAGRYWVRAACNARERGANVEVVAHLKHALRALDAQPAQPGRDRRELALLLELGGPLLMTAGHTAPEVRSVYARAEELAARTGQNGALARVLFGLFRYHCARPAFDIAPGLAQRLFERGETSRQPHDVVLARYALGYCHLYMGDPIAAGTRLDEGVRAYFPALRRFAAFTQGQDPGVGCIMFAAKAAWLAGDPGAAHRLRERGLQAARLLADPFTRTFASNVSAMLAEADGDVQQAREHAEVVEQLAEEHGFAVWAAYAAAHRGWCLARSGRTAEGIEALARWRHDALALEVGILQPFFLWLLAQAWELDGQGERALATLDEALLLAARTSETWWEAALHCARAELLYQRCALPPAVESLERALQVSRAQHARTLELRAALALARLHARAGSPQQAEALLAPVCGSFPADAPLPDLHHARGLLRELTAAPGGTR